MVRELAQLQRAPEAGEGEATPAQEALPVDVQRVRTFDTPEFAGMRFLEVETKSALNRVQGMPFSWSINPYRGCSHACAYCLAGDTPILMADGRPKALAEIAQGDTVYGTVREGSYRRYALTQVRDKWSTTKAAYRIRLADGTQLVASGDHRFLTDRGWKFVAGAQCGIDRRPHLTLNNALMGSGGFVEPPKPSPEYRRGYLCGVIRGDGHIGSYVYARTGRRHGNVHRFRLALADAEPLDRTASYLDIEGVGTQRFAFSIAGSRRESLAAIRTSSRGNVEAIRDLVMWPTVTSDDWCKGFLAGIFDAEGSCNRGVLRISNTSTDILSWIACCLDRFAFSYVVETHGQGCPTVRLRGGLRERLRFFHSTDPAILRKRSIEGVALKSDAPLEVEAIEALDCKIPMYDITTGTGDFIANGVVSHNCFARPSHAYLNLSPGEDFDKTVVVKTNVAEVLRREVAKPSWTGEHVAMGTNTDPYQRAEGRYRLMPGVIDTLAQSRTPFSILTKGTLITRDTGRLVAAAQHVPVSAAFTVGMLDEGLWHEVEPGTPTPRARLQAVRALNDAGIPTGVMLAPIMPGLNDDHEQLDALVSAAVDAGATHITPIALHLRTSRPNAPQGASVREVFWPWLASTHPDLEGRYRQLYGRAAAADASWREPVERFVAARREAHWRERGRPAQPATPRRGHTGPAEPEAAEAADAHQQLTLL